MRAGRESDVEPIVHDHAGPRSSHRVNALRDQLCQRAPLEIFFTNLDQADPGSGGCSNQRNQSVGSDAMSIGNKTENRFHGNRRG